MLRKLLAWSVTALIVTSSTSHAEEFDDLDSKWVPATTFAVTVHNEDVDMIADNPINYGFTDTKTQTLASLRFGAELMSPVLDFLPAKPRMFAFAGVLWSTPGNGSTRSGRTNRSRIWFVASMLTASFSTCLYSCSITFLRSANFGDLFSTSYVKMYAKVVNSICCRASSASFELPDMQRALIAHE